MTRHDALMYGNIQASKGLPMQIPASYSKGLAKAYKQGYDLWFRWQEEKKGAKKNLPNPSPIDMAIWGLWGYKMFANPDDDRVRIAKKWGKAHGFRGAVGGWIYSAAGRPVAKGWHDFYSKFQSKIMAQSNPRKRVSKTTSKWFPASRVQEFDPNRFDIRWNQTFTKFRAIPLQWWDDASYAAYQARDLFPEQNPMKRISRFQRGRGFGGAGAYKCRKCGKMTRETGFHESSEAMCAACFHEWERDQEEAGIENEHFDGFHKDKPASYCPICRGDKPDPFKKAQKNPYQDVSKDWRAVQVVVRARGYAPEETWMIADNVSIRPGESLEGFRLNWAMQHKYAPRDVRLEVF